MLHCETGNNMRCKGPLVYIYHWITYIATICDRKCVSSQCMLRLWRRCRYLRSLIQSAQRLAPLRLLCTSRACPTLTNMLPTGNHCKCSNGTPVTGAACTSDGAEKCETCNAGYTKKRGDRCVGACQGSAQAASLPV